MDEPAKRCCTCSRVLPLTHFNVRRAARDGLQSRCRECSRVWYQRNAQEHKANVRRRNARVRGEAQRLLIDYLRTHPCVDCGETDLRCLEFDHRDPSRKRAAVGRIANQALPWEHVLREIAECDVRCANCHRRVTARQRGWRRDVAQEAARAAAGAASAARLARVLPAEAGTATQ